MRFAVSLKRSAELGGRERQPQKISSVYFAGDAAPDRRLSTVCEDVEMDPLDQPLVREWRTGTTGCYVVPRV